MATTINKLDKSNLQSENSFSSVAKNSLPKSPTNNLDVSAATYLGGKDDDFTNAVDISVDGNFVIVGGSLKNAQLGGEETELLGGGDGTIVRYNAQTNEAVATTRLPGRILDLEVSKNGDIAVAYQGGIAVLNADATEVKWSESFNDVARIAISDSGKVGIVRSIEGADKSILFDSNGEQLKEWSTNSDKRQFEDIAVTDRNGGMVIATGYEQKEGNLQVAFTQAWSYQGKDVWKNYDFDEQLIYRESLKADTRGQRVAIGRDGQLYSSYQVDGGTGSSILYRDPFDLLEKITSDRKIETDQYTKPTNIGSAKVTWYGRYDLQTGDLVKGQSLLGRLGDKGNSIDVDSITATEDGTVILGGSAAYKIANRDEQTIEGQLVNKYDGYEGYLAVISPDLSERISWTPITASDGAVAAYRNGTTAVVTTTDFEKSQITHNAIQNSAGGKNDGYLLVIGGNDVPPGTEIDTPQDEIPVEEEIPVNTGENETPVEETSVNTGENETSIEEETTVNISGDETSTEEIPVNISGDETFTEEIPVNIGENETPVEEETTVNISGDETFTEEIPVNIGENETSIEEETTVNTGENETSIEEETAVNISGDETSVEEIPVNIGENETSIEEETTVNTGENETSIQKSSIDTNRNTTLIEEEAALNLGENTTPIEKNSVNSGESKNSLEDNPQPIIEDESENSDSILPAGLIDLRNIDLDGDKQLDENVSVKFSDIESEAGYNNSVGYYAIANIDGAVEDITGKLINPGEEGYAAAALNQRIEDLRIKRDTGNLESELNEGALLLPFLIANGTVEEWMEKNSDNQTGDFPIAYFSFASANPDSKQHIRQVGNELQFEDFLGGGDNDFNDFVTKVDIESAV